jgi:hypothetical protein
MCYYTVKFKVDEDFDHWAIYCNGSETMFLPAFDEELAAELFCAFYLDMRQKYSGCVLMPKNPFTDEYQKSLADDIRQFLDATMPALDDRRRFRAIPDAWLLHLWPMPEYHDEAEDGPYKPDYTVDELILDFQVSGRESRARVELMLQYLSAWRTANRPPDSI